MLRALNTQMDKVSLKDALEMVLEESRERGHSLRQKAVHQGSFYFVAQCTACESYAAVKQDGGVGGMCISSRYTCEDIVKANDKIREVAAL